MEAQNTGDRSWKVFQQLTVISVIILKIRTKLCVIFKAFKQLHMQGIHLWL